MLPLKTTITSACRTGSSRISQCPASRKATVAAAMIPSAQEERRYGSNFYGVRAGGRSAMLVVFIVGAGWYSAGCYIAMEIRPGRCAAERGSCPSTSLAAPREEAAAGANRRTPDNLPRSSAVNGRPREFLSQDRRAGPRAGCNRTAENHVACGAERKMQGPVRGARRAVPGSRQPFRIGFRYSRGRREVR